MDTSFEALVYVILAFDTEGKVHVVSIHRTMESAMHQVETAQTRYPTVRVAAAVLVD